MKTIGLLFLVCVTAFGQRAGVRGGGGGGVVRSGGGVARPYPYGSASGFGNAVFPGTGHPPRTTFTGTGGGVQYNFGHGSSLRGVRGGNFVYMPYPVGVPLYLGQPEEPPVQVMYPTQQVAPPQVIINQNFMSETARPVVRDYVSDQDGGVRAYEPQRSDEPQTYLIAFKDHTIYAALAYWVEGDTLHYVTNQNTHNQVSLDLIDRDLSNRFNRERNVDFRLPPAR